MMAKTTIDYQKLYMELCEEVKVLRATIANLEKELEEEMAYIDSLSYKYRRSY